MKFESKKEEKRALFCEKMLLNLAGLFIMIIIPTIVAGTWYLLNLRWGYLILVTPVTLVISIAIHSYIANIANRYYNIRVRQINKKWRV